MKLFIREKQAPVDPQILKIVPELISESNRLLRSGCGQRSGLIERLMARGEMRKFNPEQTALKQILGSLPHVEVDEGDIDLRDVCFQVVKRRRTRIILLEFAYPFGTQADLKSYSLTLDPRHDPQILYYVKHGFGDPRVVDYRELPGAPHFEKTKALLRTAT